MSAAGSEVPQDARVVVIGGGLSGLQCAVELARLGIGDVVVVEAGPPGTGKHINATHDAEEADRKFLAPGADRNLWRSWTSLSEPHYAGDSGLRRVLGGRSLYWQGVVLPLEDWVLADACWPRSVVRDLTESFRDGPSLYARARAELAEWTGPSGLQLAEMSIGSFTGRWVPAARRAVAGGNGLRWAAYSPLDYWTGDEAPPAVRIVTEAQVDSVKTTGGNVSGVAIRTQQSESIIRCTEAVLAAGTIENSRLAIQARPGGMNRLGGLVDHISHGFTVLLEPGEAPPSFAAAAAIDAQFYAPCADGVRSNLFVRLYHGSSGELIIEGWAIGEQLPGPGGYVECHRGDAMPWPVTVKAAITPSDADLIQGQRAALQELSDQISLACGIRRQSLTFPDYGDPASTMHTTVTKVERAAAGDPVITWCGLLGAEDHESSTLPLGSLLNDRHELHDVPGLYAAGPCSFPRPGAANPSLTTIALAKRLAHAIAWRTKE